MQTLMPNKTKAEIERAVLAALVEGVSIEAVREQFGMCDRTVRAIKYRNGVKATRVGRPCIDRPPLTAEQEALVVEYMETARWIAWGECREHSNRPDFDRDEYVSTAYMALVIAAAKWEKRSSFKRFLRKCIKTSLQDVRRKEMLSQGWARGVGKGFSGGMVHVVQITSLPSMR
jgi:transposase-like protein